MKTRLTTALALILGLAGPAAAQDDSILNVSYDIARELFAEINPAFAAQWQETSGRSVAIEQSHAGSSKQARAILEGLPADVVTFNQVTDIDVLAEGGMVDENWRDAFPNDASPYYSLPAFLVREGNPKGITDWGDLIKDGVEVITPNPKTSGGARWAYLAAWAWAEKAGRDPRAFEAELFAHVPVLDTGARGATTTFAQRGIGDVLLAWENEAHLALAELGADRFHIVVPSVSVRAEPPVALVEANLARPEQRELAEAYLNFLYTPEAQAIAFKHYYRAWDASAAAAEDVARLPALDLVDISHFGGWAQAQPEHFGAGGVFDQISTAK